MRRGVAGRAEPTPLRRADLGGRGHVHSAHAGPSQSTARVAELLIITPGDPKRAPMAPTGTGRESAKETHVQGTGKTVLSVVVAAPRRT
jgi:hypothetical protein